MKLEHKHEERAKKSRVICAIQLVDCILLEMLKNFELKLCQKFQDLD